ncbi:MAG TPA: cell division protein FtsQ/DivIB [Methylococcus sp.]|nr:cell division protein FtsQ/DivIB [Methylococcus sp.]
MRRSAKGAAAGTGGYRKFGEVLLSLLLLTSLGMAAWSGVAMVAQQSFDTVRVLGSFQRLDPDLVRAAIREKLARNYFAANMEELEAAVAAVPWVARVRLVRRWPDGIEVYVEEHRPVARWGDREFIDDQRRRFFVGGEQEGLHHLPLLAGPNGQEYRMIEVWSGLDRSFRAWGTSVAELRLSDRWSWSILLKNGVRIECGRQDPLDAVSKLLAWFPLLGKDRVALLQRVDLRYANGFAIMWRPLVQEGEDSPTKPAVTAEPV